MRAFGERTPELRQAVMSSENAAIAYDWKGCGLKTWVALPRVRNGHRATGSALAPKTDALGARSGSTLGMFPTFKQRSNALVNSERLVVRIGNAPNQPRRNGCLSCVRIR